MISTREPATSRPPHPHAVGRSFACHAPGDHPHDPHLQRGIEEALRSRGHRSLWHVTPAIRNGTVRLSGTVPSYYLKQLAQEAVRRIDGIHRIENRISVDRRRRAG